MNIWQEDFTLESQLPYNKASLYRLKLQSTTMDYKMMAFFDPINVHQNCNGQRTDMKSCSVQPLQNKQTLVSTIFDN